MRIRDSEDSDDYKPGGYHTVNLGEIYNNRYLVIKKLGYGPYSTVWLCYDMEEYRYLAMKMMKSGEFYTGAAEDEIKFLQLAQSHREERGFPRLITLIGYFYHDGPNGKHICILLEVLKMNLLQFLRIYDYAGLPIEVTQSISCQVLEGLDFLHRICGVIHTDLKPQHIMVAYTPEEYNTFIREATIEFKDMLSSPTDIQFFDSNGALILTKAEEGLVEEPEEDTREYHVREQELFLKVLNREPPKYTKDVVVKIIDLTNACLATKHYTYNIQTRQYRAPEVILGINYNHTADIWSFACILFEMLTGEYMFKPKEDRWPKPIDHLRQITEMLGKVPIQWAASGTRFKKYFNSKGKLKKVKDSRYRGFSRILKEKFRVFIDVEDFVMPMLRFRPEERASAMQCLNHEWLRMCPKEVDAKSDLSFVSNDSTNRYADNEDI